MSGETVVISDALLSPPLSGHGRSGRASPPAAGPVRSESVACAGAAASIDAT